MTNKKPLFILAGNGSNYNRGCEAIFRGTRRILTENFDKTRLLIVNSYLSNEDFKIQSSDDTDSSHVYGFMRKPYKRFDRYWFLYKTMRVVTPKSVKHVMYKDIVNWGKDASAVLALGGDNYSLDGGVPPTLCTDLDILVRSMGIPMVIWGASVGPFIKLPEYEKYMAKHLKDVHIMAREPETVRYLANLGLTENVYRVGDPAFLMESREPEGIDFQIEPDSIGLNLSPLMARFIKRTAGSPDKWKNLSAEILNNIIKKTDRNIYLIPHVMGYPGNNDYLFLKDVLSQVSDKSERVTLIPPIYSAPELKWIISKMAIFAGARMHSTIAAFSSFIPTLSFAYSIKAKGMNEDIFGHNNYCISPEDLCPEVVVEKIKFILRDSSDITEHLKKRIPEVKDLAMYAGRILKEIVK
ncbi:MAG TPA: polysaccharide pyruvyl transferase family protein [Phycisphaerales bacterium]|nr:polysaccharide pyruvyl transferase family protein [Phycisphaerales bacterium]